jgi:uncharacterized protein YeaO (DUF488 family)
LGTAWHQAAADVFDDFAISLMKMLIKTKRIYAKPETGEGARILVDRLWPRGLRKDEAKIDLWLQDIAPSAGLRKWFAHDPKKWNEFKQRYFAELNEKPEILKLIYAHAKTGVTTLLFGAKDEKHNNAVALKEFIETKRRRVVTRLFANGIKKEN